MTQTIKSIRNDNKVFTCILTYNDADLIERCIDGIYDFSDNIIIVEGLFQSTLSNVSKRHRFQKKDSGEYYVNLDNELFNKYTKPRSSDGTIEIIKNYIENKDDSKKIRFIQANEINRKVQMNKIFTVVDMHVNDWIFIVSTDEIYDKEELKVIKKFMPCFDRNSVFEVSRDGIDKYSDTIVRIMPAREHLNFYLSPMLIDSCVFLRKVLLPLSCKHVNRIEERKILSYFYYIYDRKQKFLSGLNSGGSNNG